MIGNDENKHNSLQIRNWNLIGFKFLFFSTNLIIRKNVWWDKLNDKIKNIPKHMVE